MEKQVKHFFNEMHRLNINIDDWKAYPPNTFNGITKEMAVIDTNRGIFAINTENTIFTYGIRRTAFTGIFPHLQERKDC
ncbi:hypothetical protein [Enterococcus gallinarum]|uniref:hypothetical protein n=1 Tax=Enterococcus gallinarum TaxID=1353 RepID=UPI001AD69F68|nr:hypothetical protein [Enterococcus gallinarum]MBO6417311.1 hypothetical protein [Enterococcus gallinarum]MBO6423444.1 hypothetical protein [Enterococcus gallinarum]